MLGQLAQGCIGSIPFIGGQEAVFFVAGPVTSPWRMHGISSLLVVSTATLRLWVVSGIQQQGCYVAEGLQLGQC